MLFKRHVYSSWYLRHSAAIDVALSSPTCSASCLAMDAVESRVPYRSQAMTNPSDVGADMVTMIYCELLEASLEEWMRIERAEQSQKCRFQHEDTA